MQIFLIYSFGFIILEKNEIIIDKIVKKNAVNFYMNHKDYLQPFFIDEIKNFLIENQGNILNKVSSKLRKEKI